MKHIQVKDEHVEVFMGEWTAACVLKCIKKVRRGNGGQAENGNSRV